MSDYALALLYKNLGWANFMLNKRTEAETLLKMSANLGQPLARSSLSFSIFKG